MLSSLILINELSLALDICPKLITVHIPDMEVIPDTVRQDAHQVAVMAMTEIISRMVIHMEILVDSGDLDRLDLVDILIAEVRTAQIIWEMMRQECISKRL